MHSVPGQCLAATLLQMWGATGEGVAAPAPFVYVSQLQVSAMRCVRRHSATRHRQVHSGEQTDMDVSNVCAPGTSWVHCVQRAQG